MKGKRRSPSASERERDASASVMGDICDLLAGSGFRKLPKIVGASIADQNHLWRAANPDARDAFFDGRAITRGFSRVYAGMDYLLYVVVRIDSTGATDDSEWSSNRDPGIRFDPDEMHDVAYAGINLRRGAGWGCSLKCSFHVIERPWPQKQAAIQCVSDYLLHEMHFIGAYDRR